MNQKRVLNDMKSIFYSFLKITLWANYEKKSDTKNKMGEKRINLIQLKDLSTSNQQVKIYF